MDLSDDELELARACVEKRRNELQKDRVATAHAFRLQFDQIQNRLAKLTDLLVDGTVDKLLFQNKQELLLREQARIKERLAEAEQGSCSSVARIEKTVELAKSPSMLYKTASPEKKRELLKTLLSNLVVSGKNVEITLALPFRLIAEREKTSNGRAYRGTCRTWEKLLEKLLKAFTNETAPAN